MTLPKYIETKPLAEQPHLSLFDNVYQTIDGKEKHYTVASRNNVCAEQSNESYDCDP